MTCTCEADDARVCYMIRYGEASTNRRCSCACHTPVEQCAGPFVDARDCPVHRKDVFAASSGPPDPGAPAMSPDDLKNVSQERIEARREVGQLLDRYVAVREQAIETALKHPTDGVANDVAKEQIEVARGALDED